MKHETRLRPDRLPWVQIACQTQKDSICGQQHHMLPTVLLPKAAGPDISFFLSKLSTRYVSSAKG